MLNPLVKALAGKGLAYKGLHGFQGVERFGREPDGAGEGVLRIARRLADLPAENDQRHQNKREDAKNHQGQLRANEAHDH